MAVYWRLNGPMDCAYRLDEPKAELEQDARIYRSGDERVCAHSRPERRTTRIRRGGRNGGRGEICGRVAGDTSRPATLYVLRVQIPMQKQRHRMAARYVCVPVLSRCLSFAAVPKFFLCLRLRLGGHTVLEADVQFHLLYSCHERATCGPGEDVRDPE